MVICYIRSTIWSPENLPFCFLGEWSDLKLAMASSSHSETNYQKEIQLLAGVSKLSWLGYLTGLRHKKNLGPIGTWYCSNTKSPANLAETLQNWNSSFNNNLMYFLSCQIITWEPFWLWIKISVPFFWDSWHYWRLYCDCWILNLHFVGPFVSYFVDHRSLGKANLHI